MFSLRKAAIVLSAMVLIVAGVAIGGETPWFDMANCDLCKPFMAEPKLMESMGMEHYEISNGAVMISTVEESLLPAYRTAHGKMMTEIDRIEKGDSLYLCGYCTTFGGLLAAGANLEYVETKTGDLSIMTGDKPELIADIKAMAAKSHEEMMKMEAMMEKEHKHE